jgi:hypothetical protein
MRWKRPAALDLLAVVVAVSVLARVAIRGRYGVDLTDEPFYAAIPHRYALGDWPYRDEVNLRQSAGLVVAPLMWAYYALTGSTDGVLTFLRGAYFVFTIGVAVTVYTFIRTLAPRGIALVGALPAIAFVPFCIPTFSYNTLGVGFFTAGIALGLLPVVRATRLRVSVAAGLCHGAAVLSYPPLATGVIAFGLASVLAIRRDQPRTFGAYVAGGFGLALLVLPLLAPAGVTGIRHALDYELSLTQPRNLGKLLHARDELLAFAPGAPAPIATWLAFFFAALALPRARLILAPAVAYWTAIDAWERGAEHTSALYFVIYMAVVALFVAFLALRDRLARRLVLCAFVPSMIAGATTAFSSDNGAMNAALGLLPAASLLPVVLSRALPSVPRLPWLRTWSVAASTVIVSLALVRYYERGVYRDEHVEKLHTTVEAGPFRGLRTTEARALQIEDVTRAVRAYADPSSRIVAYYDFPAAYLMTMMRPAMPSVWTDARIPVSDMMMEYYRKHLTGRGLVVRWASQNRSGPTALERLTESPQRLLTRGNGFLLYREPEPPSH